MVWDSRYDDSHPGLRMRPDPEELVPDFAEPFQVTVSRGTEWVPLVRPPSMWVSPDGLGQTSQSWRREEAQSRFYHGTFTLHATKDNVQETISVYITGESQNDVTEEIMLLEELFSQLTYQIRVQFGNHRETWYCQTADWQTERTHVLLHNTMAKMSFSVPRLPDTSKEIIL